MTLAVIGLDIILRLLLVEKKIAAKYDPGDVQAAACSNAEGNSGIEFHAAIAPSTSAAEVEKAAAAANVAPTAPAKKKLPTIY
jgi:hypothetical protein